MKIGKSRTGLLAAGSVGLVALAASSAVAGHVTVNPAAGSLRQTAGSVLAATAAVSLVGDRGDANFSQMQSGLLVRDFSSTTVSGVSGQSSWQFSLSYLAGQGYALSFTPVVTGIVRIGDGSAINFASVSSSGLIAEESDLPFATTPRVAAIGSFNFLRLRASSLIAGDSLSFGGLSFVSDLSTTGLFVGGSVDGSALGRSSIDGSAARGSFFQDIVSDTDLSQRDWTLTGLLSTGGTSLGGVAFGIDLFESSFQTLQVVPLPSGAALAVAGCMVAGLRRRR